MLAAVLAVVCGVLCLGIFVLWRGKADLEVKLREAIGASATLAQTENYLQAAKEEAAQAMRALTQAEKNEALALQKVEAAELRLKDFEQLKTQFEQYAKAAALETGSQLSNKLMADHTRAREETHKQFEQFTKTATETLMQRQQELATSLGKVQGQIDTSSAQISTLVRAMQNPIGAGAEGEIVMNNILQQHGFTPGVDYELQVHLAGEEGSLRPDCVIYLPEQQAIIIDSKASQHILALFRTEGTPEFDATFRELQASMRTHAKGLSNKTYRESIRKLKNRNGQPITRTTLVMFVPNDEVVIRLTQKDPNLMQYLREQEILLTGPNMLSQLFLLARALMREAKQQDEHHAIMELTSELMADMITALGYAEDVMKGVRTSASAYDKFAASLNKGVMSKLKRLAGKGVRPAKNKQLPGNLPRYEITKQDEIINLEPEEMPTLMISKEDAA